MKINDEIYIKLNELWWNALAANEDIRMFKDEFFKIASDEGFKMDDIEQFWNIGG